MAGGRLISARAWCGCEAAGWWSDGVLKCIAPLLHCSITPPTHRPATAMPDEVFHFQNQTWAQLRRAELTLTLLATRPGPLDVCVGIEADFVPPWVVEAVMKDDAAPLEEHRTMHLMIDGALPRLGRWQELAGLVMEHRGGIVAGAKIVQRPRHAPEVHLWSCDCGPESIHDHTGEQADARVAFGTIRRHEDGGDEIEYDMEAFYPSKRGWQERMKAMQNLSAELFHEPPPHEIDERLLEEGWTLRHKGWAEFQKIRCLVPLNVADPIGYARALARRELGMAEFGFCRVNGGGCHDETFKPEDGVCGNARLVILTPPSDHYHEMKARLGPGKPQSS